MGIRIAPLAIADFEGIGDFIAQDHAFSSWIFRFLSLPLSLN